MCVCERERERERERLLETRVCLVLARDRERAEWSVECALLGFAVDITVLAVSSY